MNFRYLLLTYGLVYSSVICAQDSAVIKLDTPSFKEPRLTTKRHGPDHDYKYLIITIVNDSLNVKYYNKPLPITTTAQLDEYFKKRSKKIEKTKILIRSLPNQKYDRFEVVLDVLTKYKIHQFELVTESDI